MMNARAKRRRRFGSDPLLKIDESLNEEQKKIQEDIIKNSKDVLALASPKKKERIALLKKVIEKKAHGVNNFLDKYLKKSKKRIIENIDKKSNDNVLKTPPKISHSAIKKSSAQKLEKPLDDFGDFGDLDIDEFKSYSDKKKESAKKIKESQLIKLSESQKKEKENEKNLQELFELQIAEQALQRKRKREEEEEKKRRAEEKKMATPLRNLLKKKRKEIEKKFLNQKKNNKKQNK